MKFQYEQQMIMNTHYLLVYELNFHLSYLKSVNPGNFYSLQYVHDSWRRKVTSIFPGKTLCPNKEQSASAVSSPRLPSPWNLPAARAQAVQTSSSHRRGSPALSGSMIHQRLTNDTFCWSCASWYLEAEANFTIDTVSRFAYPQLALSSMLPLTFMVFVRIKNESFLTQYVNLYHKSSRLAFTDCLYSN